MGVLLMLLLLAVVVSGSDVGDAGDAEGGEALPQSHAASGLLHIEYVQSVSERQARTRKTLFKMLDTDSPAYVLPCFNTNV